MGGCDGGGGGVCGGDGVGEGWFWWGVWGERESVTICEMAVMLGVGRRSVCGIRDIKALVISASEFRHSTVHFKPKHTISDSTNLTVTDNGSIHHPNPLPHTPQLPGYPETSIGKKKKRNLKPCLHETQAEEHISRFQEIAPRPPNCGPGCGGGTCGPVAGFDDEA